MSTSTMPRPLPANSLYENQIQGSEKELERLVRSVGWFGMKALEVGSWAGASTRIIGKVVKEYGGTLYCIDWWKGNPGVDHLTKTAQEHDMFRIFEQNMRQQGLDNTVFALKMPSAIAAPILRENVFDFVFIDADHRFEHICHDLTAYYPTVKPGSILCGHDCELHLKDCDQRFLEAHKDQDYVQNLHCGVILAVGRRFPDCVIRDTIWHVRKPLHGR